MRPIPGGVSIPVFSVCCLTLGAFLSLTPYAVSAGDGAPSEATGATAGENLQVVPLDSKAAIDNFQPMSAFAMKGHSVPTGAGRELFAAAKGALRIGVWEGGPGILRLTNYPHDEYCLMVSGQVVVTDEAGHKSTFRAGDSFVVPKGFSGSWDMKTKMRKQYAYALVQTGG